MTKATIVVLLSAALTFPGVSSAQTFKVAKYSIGGDGGTDYLTAELGTGRVFVSRGTHVMVIDGATGKVLGDIPDTPRNHGIALAPKSGHGFITSAGDSTVTMFDLRSLAVIKKIPVPTGGLDGIMYDDFSDRIILTNHSRPAGTLVAIDPKSGAIVATVQLDDAGRQDDLGRCGETHRVSLPTRVRSRASGHAAAAAGPAAATGTGDRSVVLRDHALITR